jgi:hypothetical protein
LGIVANEAAKVTEAVTPYVQEKLGNREALEQSIRRLPGFRHIAPYSEQILNKVAIAVSGLGNFIFKGASAFTAGTFVFLLDFAIMLYAKCLAQNSLQLKTKASKIRSLKPPLLHRL